MKDTRTNTLTHAGDPHFRHLPFYSALKGYEESQWLCFGTLTHALPTSAATQVRRFEKLMHKLGSLNGSFGKRLHWVVRVEGGADGTSLERRVRQATGLEGGQQHTHLHFLLARHKVADGHNHQFTAEEAGAFLETEWPHGRCEVVPYVVGKDGVGYITKCPGGPNSSEWNDRCELSDALKVHLAKLATQAPARDPFAEELVAMLNQRGHVACFGDQMVARRKSA